MLTNFLRNKCTILEKEATLGPLGNVEMWSAVGSYWCRRIPVDVATRMAYMQNNTVVTDKFLFNAGIELKLGKHRIEFGGKVYELAESSMNHEGQVTVLVQEMG